MTKNLNVKNIKNYVFSRGLLLEVLRNVAGIPNEILANPGKEFPCPLCGGDTRCSLRTKGTSEGIGRVVCSHCGTDNHDFLDVIKWMKSVSLNEAVNMVSEYVQYNENENENRTVERIPQPKEREPRMESQTEYIYTDENGIERYKVTRTDLPDYSKRFCQYHYENGQWVPGIGTDEKGKKRSVIPYPYRLKDLMNQENKHVIITEGEKCADTAREVLSLAGDICATTLAGGANSARHWETMLSYLENKGSVFICEDNDRPGRTFAIVTAYAIKENCPDVDVYIVPFDKKPNGEIAPEKYDIADYIQDLGDISNLEKAEHLIEFFTNVTPFDVDCMSVDPDEPEEKDPPFPVELFHPSIKEYGLDVATLTKTDPSFFCTGAMSALSCAIGKRFIFNFSRWGERILPTFNGVVIGVSGSGKSPAVKQALKPIKNKQWELSNERDKAIKEHNIANPKDLISSIDMESIYSTDETIESIQNHLYILETLNSLYGYLYHADEFNVMLKGINAYSKNSDNTGKFITALDCEGFYNNRRTGACRHSFTKEPVFSIVGGIQPPVLFTELEKDGSYTTSGFIQRFLWAFPPRVKKCTPKWKIRKTKLENRIYYDTLFSDIMKLNSETKKQIKIEYDDQAVKTFLEYEEEIDKKTDSINAEEAVRLDALGAYITKSKKTILQISAIFCAVDLVDKYHENLEKVPDEFVVYPKIEQDLTPPSFVYVDGEPEQDEPELEETEPDEPVKPELDPKELEVLKNKIVSDLYVKQEHMERAIELVQWYIFSFNKILKKLKKIGNFTDPKDPFESKVCKKILDVLEQNGSATVNELQRKIQKVDGQKITADHIKEGLQDLVKENKVRKETQINGRGGKTVHYILK
ncbi:MAG: DUF3987 domain-containing protein [Planctomycetia bacterium]|nr:DUF3987 domain-containing protein [Planctomycetia bacterium]